MQTLDVINAMLATIGEAPLASVEEAHNMKGACLRTFNGVNSRLQAKGHWFNREYITLSPNPDTGEVYISGDTLDVRADRRVTKVDYLYVARRGSRLYNMDGGTYVFTANVDIELLRKVPFEQLPEVAAQWIASVAVYEFQKDYDGDSEKTRQLKAIIFDPQTNRGTEKDFKDEATRQDKGNWLRSNSKLQRLKRLTRGARANVRTRW